MEVLVHRLRRRFRELVKGEVAATLENPLDINQEIDYLIEALSYSLGGSTAFEDSKSESYFEHTIESH